MTVSAEKIVIMCYEGVGAGKKMEPRIHMTVSFFSVPSICQNFHHGFVSNLMTWSKRFLVHAAILGLQVGICKFGTSRESAYKI